MRALGFIAVLTTFAAPAWAGIITVTPVPEPATLSVLAAGVGALALLRRRRK